MTTYPVTYDHDPDNDEAYSIFTDTGGIDAEICGKIYDVEWAQFICELLNQHHNSHS